MLSFDNPNNFRSIVMLSLLTERPIEITGIKILYPYFKTQLPLREHPIPIPNI
jgi:hypothetical protein